MVSVDATTHSQVLGLTDSGYATCDLTPLVPVILCVDDDPSLISSMQRGFRRYRAKLEVAFHGMQGVVSAIESKPDIIVTDLQMPFASGEELIECLSQHPSTTGVPIVILTGRPGAVLTSRMKKLGVRCVLSKPLSFEGLIAELRKIIPIEVS
jgi:CheY-like chemotaxis protein